jgi:hypothetical protein
MVNSMIQYNFACQDTAIDDNTLYAQGLAYFFGDETSAVVKPPSNPLSPQQQQQEKMVNKSSVLPPGSRTTTTNAFEASHSSPIGGISDEEVLAIQVDQTSTVPSADTTSKKPPNTALTKNGVNPCDAVLNTTKQLVPGQKEMDPQSLGPYKKFEKQTMQAKSGG